MVRRDPDYDKFMTAQLLLGLGNIMSFSLLAIVLREVFDAGYVRSLVVTTGISFLVMPCAVPFWARLLDGVHIARFRAIHSWVFVSAIARGGPADAAGLELGETVTHVDGRNIRGISQDDYCAIAETEPKTITTESGTTYDAAPIEGFFGGRP